MNEKHIYIIKAIKSIYFSNYYCAIYERTCRTFSFENSTVFIDGAQCKIRELDTGKCNVCDPFNLLTFTDFCRVVHKTKPTGS